MVEKGYITRPVNSAYSAGAPISQAAKLILDAKEGLINQSDADAVLNELASREAYRDVKKYLLQPSFSQQYNFIFLVEHLTRCLTSFLHLMQTRDLT